MEKWHNDVEEQARYAGRALATCYSADTQEPHAGKVDLLVAMLHNADLDAAADAIFALICEVQDGVRADCWKRYNG